MIFGALRMSKEINQIGKDVINLQIKALKKLKNSLNQSFELAVKQFINASQKL